MFDLFKEFLDNSVTPYHVTENVTKILSDNGYTELKENNPFKVKVGGKYYVCRDKGCLIAFVIGNVENNYSYKIVASHTDSPVLKIKTGGEYSTKEYVKLETENYGGTILYSWFDRPLNVSGRVVVSTLDGRIIQKLINEDTSIVIPSLAVHLNRQVNSGFSPNSQTDMQPLCGLFAEKKYIDNVIAKILNDGESIIDYDLFLIPSTKGFYSGLDGELFSSPRIDNLASVFSSCIALTDCKGDGVSVMCLYNHEEVGSRTMEGAGGTFLIDTIKRINLSLGKNEEDLMMAMSKSFFVSCDGAHAVHPNHTELSSTNSQVYLGKGIVVKHHANRNYTTDAVSSSVIKYIFKNNGVPYQDFFIKSDMQCGGTLGAISSSQFSVRSVDIGISQLAMHSTVETMATVDLSYLINGLSAFYNSSLDINNDEIKIK